MKLETKNVILKNLDSNLALIRDEDWAILCLLWRDEEWYFVYYMEHYNISREEALWILDKSAWIAFIPTIDEQAESQYKKELREDEKIVKKQIKQLWE